MLMLNVFLFCFLNYLSWCFFVCWFGSLCFWGVLLLFFLCGGGVLLLGFVCVFVCFNFGIPDSLLTSKKAILLLAHRL